MQRADDMVAGLAADGHPIDWEDVLGRAGGLAMIVLAVSLTAAAAVVRGGGRERRSRPTSVHFSVRNRTLRPARRDARLRRRGTHRKFGQARDVDAPKAAIMTDVPGSDVPDPRYLEDPR